MTALSKIPSFFIRLFETSKSLVITNKVLTKLPLESPPRLINISTSLEEEEKEYIHPFSLFFLALLTCTQICRQHSTLAPQFRV